MCMKVQIFIQQLPAFVDKNIQGCSHASLPISRIMRLQPIVKCISLRFSHKKILTAVQKIKITCCISLSTLISVISGLLGRKYKRLWGERTRLSFTPVLNRWSPNFKKLCFFLFYLFMAKKFYNHPRQKNIWIHPWLQVKSKDPGSNPGTVGNVSFLRERF